MSSLVEDKTAQTNTSNTLNFTEKDQPICLEKNHKEHAWEIPTMRSPSNDDLHMVLEEMYPTDTCNIAHENQSSNESEQDEINKTPITSILPYDKSDQITPLSNISSQINERICGSASPEGLSPLWPRNRTGNFIRRVLKD